MEYIRSKDIFLLMRDVLRFIHPKPMEHGSRVAYMVYLMLKESGEYEEFELADIVMIATMHDIGAYKTEAGKINDILRYEMKDSMPHAIYGYLFFKYLSPVPNLAKIILYHNMDYLQLNKVDYKYKKIAQYINIAEKMDVYSTSMGSQFNVHMFDKMAGSKLSSNGLELFHKIEAEHGIFARIKSGEYMQELNEIIDYMIFNNEEKKKFLEMVMYCLGFKGKIMLADNITTARICEDIAQEIVASEAEREVLYYSALVHDIGMLAMPREIINASRKLSPDEATLLRTHVDIMEKTLKDNHMHEGVCSIARAHHERCDGSGYPDHLTDIQMNMPQRILQVADVVTALVNPRSYRKPLPKEKVIAILKEEASKRHLKQQVVTTFVKFYDQIMERVRKESVQAMKMYEALNMQYELIGEKYKI